MMPTPLPEPVAGGVHARLDNASPARRLQRSASKRLESLRDSLSAQAVATFIVFLALWRLLLGYTTLPAASYARFSMLASSVYWPPMWLIVPLLVAPLLITWRRSRWLAVDPSGRTRIFVLAVTLIFGWTFSTYNTNLFFGQEHTIDRLALIALSAIVWLHPSMFMLQMVVMLIILGQLNYPLPESGWHYADKRLPLDALVLFTAFLQIRLIFKATPRLYLYCLICLVGVVYAYPAILKLGFGPRPWSWILDNNLSNLFVSAHTNGGWLRSLTPDSVADIARILDILRLPMAGGTVLLEASPLLMLAHPRATRWVPVGLIGLHVLILLASGIFFWKWIVFHIALLWYLGRLSPHELARGRTEWSGGIYRWRMLALAPLLMVMTWLVLALTPFVWADTRLANFFVIRGIGESGATYRLEPRFFAPYDLTVQQSRFYFAFAEPVLVGTFGTTDRFELAQRLEAARLEDLPAIRREFGRVYFDEAGARALRNFLERSVHMAMIGGKRDHWLYHFAPPHHFQTSRHPDAYEFQEPLKSVTLTFEEWFWDGEQLHLAREVGVTSIEIDPSQPPPRRGEQ